jgi:TonB family protein
MRNPPRQTRPAEEKKKALRLQADDRGEHRVVDDRNAKAQRSRRSRKLVIRPKDSQLQRLFAKKWAEEAERNKDPHRRKSHGRASASPSGRRWKKIRAAIENYIAEVKPGRVTALRTRHHPFAKYIAAAHRKIHPLWGDGILQDWDSKPKEHPLSVRSRWAMVEMVINRDGTLYKAGLVKSSGYLVYDAAALDVVFSAAPYPRAPKKILSADGKVYLHWRFHRDHRQCGTFGVDAYILTNPPKGKQVDRAHTKKRSDSVRWDPGRSLDRVRRKTGAMKGRAVEVGGSGSSGGSGGSGGSGVSGGSGGSGGSAGRSYAPSPNRKSPPGGKPSGEGSTGGKPSGEGSTGGESSRRSGPVNPASAANDAETAEVASGWLRAVSAKDIDTLLELSAVPFSANGRVVARKPKELRAAFTGLLGDSTGSRGPATSKRVYVLSGAELRRYLGALPSRLKTDPSHTYAVGTISGQRVILVMEESQGKSKIIGIFR